MLLETNFGIFFPRKSIVYEVLYIRKDTTVNVLIRFIKEETNFGVGQIEWSN